MHFQDSDASDVEDLVPPVLQLAGARDPDHVFTAVTNYPGVVTCPPLRKYKLGIAASIDVLCCIECPRGMLLKLSLAAEHVRLHAKKGVMVLTNAVLDVCSKYNVFAGDLRDLPPPPHPAPPFRFLPIVDGYMCEVCEAKGVTFMAASEGTRKNHFTNKHPRTSVKYKGGPRPERLVRMQSYLHGQRARTWFQVLEELQEDVDPDDVFSQNVSPDELFDAYVKSWKAPVRGAVSVASVKDVQPWIHYNGWAAHVSKYEPAFLCELVQPPDKNTPLRRVLDAAVREFKADQATLSSTPQVHRTEIMDEGTGPPKHELRALEDKTATTYGQYWGLFIVFVMRLRRRQLQGDHRYAVTMTESQQRCIDRAWKYAEMADGRPRARRMLLDVSRWFWCPKSMDDFSHMASDQFDDPTVRFGILISLKPNGSFLMPRDASSMLVRIKYFIRASLYMWSRHEQLDKNLPVHSIVSLIAPGLTRRALSPFCSTSIGVSHATLYAGTSTHMPNVVWTNDTRVVVLGQDIDFKDFQTAFRSLLERTEKLLYESVLLGESLKDFGWTIDKDTSLCDTHHRTDPGYSMFEDSRNPFFKLRFAMARRLLRPGRADFLHRGKDSKGKVAWVDSGVERWLDDLAECTRLLAVVMQLCGGQPCRGVEFCLMKAVNELFRVRNVHWVNPGMLVYVMYYSKSTSNTGLDRVVAHAVPWRVAKIFLVLHGLVKPFAVELVKHLHGEEAAYVQEHSAFALCGKEMVSAQLSDECGEFFLKSLGVKVKLRTLRQFMIASQRQFMPESFGPVYSACNVVDAQAGHSTETALAHYAIVSGELRLFSHATAQKYIAASSRWWVVLCPPRMGILTEDEVEAGGNAPKRIALLAAEDSDAPALGRSGPLLDPGQLAQEIRSMRSELGELRGAVGRLRLSSAPNPSVGDCAETGRERPPTENAVGPPAATSVMAADHWYRSEPAPFIEVEPKHLLVLRTYAGDPSAKWTSRAQGQAFVHTHSRHRSLLVVLPTGGGKSVVFGAVTLLESGVTAVVFPMRALLQDQVGSLRSKGVAVAVWPVDDTVADGVVAVSAESAGSQHFMSWVHQMVSARRLNRIVVDEVHLLETARDYRPTMTHMRGLVRSGVPLVALSGTVPPVMEPQLCDLLGRPNWSVVRESTQRSNLVLRIANFASARDAERSLVMHVEQYKSELRPGEGILVQCRSYSDVERVAELLDCPQFSGALLEADRDRNASEWLSGRFSVIAATSGLGTGVHHPACRVVIHYKHPYTFVDYGQEAGRAGRDGLPAVCIVLIPRPLPSPPEKNRGGWDKLVEMLDGTGCMRLHMSRYLDGEALASTCSDGGHAMCTNCARTMLRAADRPGVALAIPDLAASGPKTFSPAEWIEEHLPTWTGPTVAPSSPPSWPAAVAATPPPAARVLTLGPGVQRDRLPVVSSAHPILAVSPEPAAPTASTSTSHVDRVLRMSSNALPSPPVGTQVAFDSEAAHRRSQVANNLAMEQELLYAPFDFGTLMKVKKTLANRCVYCLLFHTRTTGHTLSGCPHAPDKGRSYWALNSHRRNNDRFSEVKKTVYQLPGNGSICFRCWWSLTLDHPKVEPPNCTGKDQILPVCWMAFCDDKLRQDMDPAFGVGLDSFTGEQYITWLSGSHRVVDWFGKSQLLLNAHVVLLWVMFKKRDDFAFVYSKASGSSTTAF